VPSGNFGNLCAGLMARRLGAPIRALVAATNLNRTVPDFLDGRAYAPRPSVATLSNAMDVGAPSNWQRVVALYGGDNAALRRDLRWGSADEDDTRAALADLRSLGYRADPHTAVAWSVLRDLQRAEETGVVLATAHPAKFDFTRDRDAPLPETLDRALKLPLLAEPLVSDSRELRGQLRNWSAQPDLWR
jgi:threonine synthase